jgi:hypothetical protein
MPITYTNRKGVTYHLCAIKTKRGNTRYVFAREPKGEPLDAVPDGWEIRESVNGLVSLGKERAQVIRDDELAAVRAALARHPHSEDYRAAIKDDTVMIYERSGPNADALIEALSRFVPAERVRTAHAYTAQRANYEPVMRFRLRNEATRRFTAERMSYSGRGGWRDLHLVSAAPIDELADRLVPKLGTDAFFNLH